MPARPRQHTTLTHIERRGKKETNTKTELTSKLSARHYNSSSSSGWMDSWLCLFLREIGVTNTLKIELNIASFFF